MQGWGSDRNRMVMDIRLEELQFFTYFRNVINEGPLSQALSMSGIVIVIVF